MYRDAYVYIHVWMHMCIHVVVVIYTAICDVRGDIPLVADVVNSRTFYDVYFIGFLTLKGRVRIHDLVMTLIRVPLQGRVP